MKAVFKNFVGRDKTVNFTVESIDVTSSSDIRVNLTSKVAFVGFDSIPGNFSGLIDAKCSTVKEGAVWQIGYEDWLFVQYEVGYSLG